MTSVQFIALFHICASNKTAMTSSLFIDWIPPRGIGEPVRSGRQHWSSRLNYGLIDIEIVCRV